MLQYRRSMSSNFLIFQTSASISSRRAALRLFFNTATTSSVNCSSLMSSRPLTIIYMCVCVCVCVCVCMCVCEFIYIQWSGKTQPDETHVFLFYAEPTTCAPFLLPFGKFILQARADNSTQLFEASFVFSLFNDGHWEIFFVSESMSYFQLR